MEPKLLERHNRPPPSHRCMRAFGRQTRGESRLIFPVESQPLQGLLRVQFSILHPPFPSERQEMEEQNEVRERDERRDKEAHATRKRKEFLMRDELRRDAERQREREERAESGGEK